ncbi:MAG: hypothetical protein MJZ34_13825 [Paludibacteraceae bacterium]|nr:hypothetical protein [Paludibacteraceae bacterium]
MISYKFNTLVPVVNDNNYGRRRCLQFKDTSDLVTEYKVHLESIRLLNFRVKLKK